MISGAMIGRAVQEMLISGQIKESKLCELGDDTLVNLLMKDDAPDVTKQLARAWIERKLHKQFKCYTWDDFSVLQSHDHTESIEEIIKARFIDPDNRKDLEDTIANEINSKSGDVLIYAPQRSMNMKAAETKVIWNGSPKALKDIDDRLLAPRLKEIIEAHKALWRTSIICSRNLEDDKLKLLKTA
ncbi:MAG: hypothetical protein ABSB79_15125, partial [Syntrophales bacterium]